MDPSVGGRRDARRLRDGDVIDAATTALRCVDALESAGLTCAIGGAIALGVWCPPRATLDVDLNIFVETTQAAAALAPLLALGATGEPELLVRRLQAGDMAMMHLDGVRLDIFLPSIPFYGEAEQRIVRVQPLGKSVPVLSAETIAVFKLLFLRKGPRGSSAARRVHGAWARPRVGPPSGCRHVGG